MMGISLGSWRFFLSFLVAISHLYKDMFGGPAAYAVWGFFVLSGFLMTEILRHRYGFSKDGLFNYAFNRGLRILPAYWVALGFGAVTITVLSSHNMSLSEILNPEFHFPRDFTSWFANITLIPLFHTDGRLVPVSGALGVEVGIYILIPLMAMNRSATWIGIILSLLLSMQYGFESGTFADRYSYLLTSFFAFAVGSLVSHYKNELQGIKAPSLSISIWILHCFVIVLVGSWPWTYGLYLSAALSAWVVISYADIKGSRWDVLLGDLSYPVYLFHTTVAAWMLFFFAPDRSLGFFVVSFLVTLLVSWLVLKLVDEPLHRFKVSSKSRTVARRVENSLLVGFVKIIFVKLMIFIIKVKKNSSLVLSSIAILILSIVLYQGYKILTNDILIIKDWGPKNTKTLVVPNEQPDGNAAIWIATSMTYGLGELKVVINNQPAENTIVSRKLVIGVVPPELFNESGKLDIVIEQVASGQKFKVGTMTIDD